MVMVKRMTSFYEKNRGTVNIITFCIMIASAGVSIGLYTSMGIETKNHLMQLDDRFTKHIISDEERFLDLKHTGTDVAIRTEAKVDLLLMIYGINPDQVSDFSLMVKSFKSNPRGLPKVDSSTLLQQKANLKKEFDGIK